MATGSINDMKMAHATQFTDRVQHQLVKYAREDVIGDGTPPNNQTQRVLLANRVLSDPGNMAGKLAVSLVSQAGISGTYAAGPPVDSTAQDEDIYAAINAQWDKWLGVV